MTVWLPAVPSIWITAGLYHHFENGCFMVDCPAVDEIKHDFKHTFSQCREVTEKYKTGLGAHLRLGTVDFTVICAAYVKYNQSFATARTISSRTHVRLGA